MATKLLGYESGSLAAHGSADRLFCSRFQATDSGTCNVIYVRPRYNTGYTKVGIYADNYPNPGTLLTANTNGVYVDSALGWNAVALETPISITSGTYYWLAQLVDTVALVGVDPYTGANYTTYYDLAYSSGIPSSPGTADGSYVYGFFVAGYEDTLIVTEPGSFSYTGSSVTFNKELSLVTGQASYVYSGGSVELQSVQAYIDIDPTAFSYTGGNIDLLSARNLVMGQGLFACSGGTVSLSKERYIQMKYIPYTDNSTSSADAETLEDLDLNFDGVAPLDYKIVRFKIGNDGSTKTTYTLSATGTNVSQGTYIYENIYFSADKIGGKGTNALYSDILDLGNSIEITLDPNEVSSTIWAIFACTPDYYGGSAQVIIKAIEAAHLKTTYSGSFNLRMAGTGSVYVDWGDGSDVETIVLSDDSSLANNYHSYSDSTEKTILIYGDIDIITRIYLVNMEITDIYNIARMTALEDIYLEGNDNLDIDISVFLTVESLDRLDLKGTGVTGSFGNLVSGNNLTELVVYEANNIVCDTKSFGLQTSATIDCRFMGWTSTEVDNFLIQAAAAEWTSCNIHVSLNESRTSASDVAYAYLDANNTVDI